MELPLIMILDDHAAFGQSFGQLLQHENFAKYEAVSSVPAALALLARTKPSLAIIDITLKQRFEGLDFLMQMTREWPHIKTMCLTKHANKMVCEQAFAAGTWGYFTKTAPVQETLEGIRHVLGAAKPLPQPSFKGQKPHFTPREQEILALLATGASNKELARSLSMAEETAKVHMKTLLRKLGVSNRTQVAIYAYENGFWPMGQNQS